MKFTYYDILNFEAEYGEEFLSDEAPGADFFLNHKPFRESVIKELFPRSTYEVRNIIDVDDLLIAAEVYFVEETHEEINEVIKRAFVVAIDEHGLGEQIHAFIGIMYD